MKSLLQTKNPLSLMSALKSVWFVSVSEAKGKGATCDTLGGGGCGHCLEGLAETK